MPGNAPLVEEGESRQRGWQTERSANRRRGRMARAGLLRDVAEAWKGKPHQIQALDWLQYQIEQHCGIVLEEFINKYSPSDAAAAVTVRLGSECPYFSQKDSAVAGMADRSCMASATAMALEAYRPGALKGENGDDAYLRAVLTYGDTTNPQCQVKALAQFGLEARFRSDVGAAQLDMHLAKYGPVPIGVLHHGPLTGPTGGGHWVTVYARDETGYWLHDPYGELDWVSGEWLHTGGTTGKGLHVSSKSLHSRWMPDGPSTGWAILATS